MPRAKQRTRELRDKVLDIAVTALNEHGISGFTTRRVAELAGTSVPAVQRVGGARILGVDRVVDVAQRVGGRVDACGDQIDHLGGVLLVRRELGQAGGRGDGVGAAVGNGVEGPHPLGDRVAGLTSGVDHLVELQGAGRRSWFRRVPVGVLALDVQLDQVDQDALQVGGQP